jgi:hypothetical protein
MKYKASIYTLISLMLVIGATIFTEFWCPWMIVIPSKLVFAGYGFLAVSAFLNPNLKDRAWIYCLAVSVSVLRMILIIFPYNISISWNSFDSIVKYAEPAVVMFIGLASFTFALWRRFIKIQT